jgi:hypothetical protein
VLFKTILADLEARRDQQRVALAFVIFRRGRADIADQMPDRRPGGIIARIAALGDDAGHFGQAHADGGELVPVELGGDFDRLEATGLFQLVLDVADLVCRQPEQPGQPGQRGIGIDQPVGDHVDTEIGAVGGERRAIAVEHPAPARGDQREVDAVALRGGLVLGVLEDREIGQARGQQHAHRRLPHAQHERAPLETVCKDGRSERELLLRLLHHVTVS